MAKGTGPAVSVVVSVLNREREMEGCIKALLNQSHPSYEIIVVDGGSSDGTLEMLRNYKKSGREKIKVFLDKRPGRNYARNLGISKAKGKILAFTDSDCLPEKSWLSELTKPFKSQKVGGVIGTTLADRKGVFWYHMENIGYIQYIGHNTAYRAGLVRKLGGFDVRFKIAKEDTDLAFRVMEAGYDVAYAPKARLTHQSRRANIFYRIRNQRTFVYDGLLRKKHPELYANHMGYSDARNTGIVTGLLLASAASLPTFPWFFAAMAVVYALAAIGKLIRADGSQKESLEFLLFAWLIPPARFFNFLRGFWRFRNAEK